MGRAGTAKSDLALLKDPDELLHKYLLLKDENTLLKNHNGEQEEKIKKLATKLVRITADLKKRYDEESGTKVKGPKVRDYQAEEKISELEQELRDWKRKCEQLRNKNDYLAQLVPANKGGKQKAHIARRPSSATTSRVRAPPPPPPPKAAKPVAPAARTANVTAPVNSTDVDTEFPVQHMEKTQSLLGAEETADIVGENNALQMQILKLQTEMAVMKKQASAMTDQVAEAELAKKEAEAMVDKMTGSAGHRPRRGSNAGVGGHNSIYTDEDYTALQREMRIKVVDLTAVQSKYEALYKNEQRMVKEVENKNSELKQEREKALELGREAAKLSMKAQQCDAYKTQYEHERESRESVENQLKSLTKKIFNVDNASAGAMTKLRTEIDLEKKNVVRVLILSLRLGKELKSVRRAALKAVVDILKLGSNARSETLVVDNMKDEMKKMKKELTLLKEDGQIDTTMAMEIAGRIEDNADSKAKKLQKQLDEKNKDFKEMMKEMQRMQELIKSHDAVKSIWDKDKQQLEEEKAELEESLKEAKLRKQGAINASDSKTEERSSKHAEENSKLKKQVRQLEADLSATKLIAKQAQSERDLAEAHAKASSKDGDAYVPSIKNRSADIDMSDSRQIKASDFEDGPNVLELSVMSAALEIDAIEELGLTDQVSTFLLLDFASHQPTTTKLVSGLSPAFDLDIEFAVEVNAFFLELLATEPIIAEMYVRGGTNHGDASVPVATARIFMVDLLKRPDNRILSNVDLMTASERGQTARSIGTLQFSVGLKKSIAEIAQRYREVASADLQATLSRTGGAFSAANPHDAKVKIGVHILGASGLRALPNGAKPSPCVAYQFFNFPPCDTEAVVGSTEPEFDDVRYYEVARDSHLKTYLKSAELDIAIFDDSGVAADMMLGSALVKLDSLLQKESVMGQYTIKDSRGEAAGKINIELYWVRPDAPRGEHIMPEFGSSSGQAFGRGSGSGLIGRDAPDRIGFSHSMLGVGSGVGSGVGALGCGDLVGASSCD